MLAEFFGKQRCVENAQPQAAEVLRHHGARNAEVAKRLPAFRIERTRLPLLRAHARQGADVVQRLVDLLLQQQLLIRQTEFQCGS